jgi:hypothetical protein
MWLELLAYDAQGEVIEESSSGNIGDRELEEKPPGDPRHDPQLFMLRDRMYDARGEPVQMFWAAAPSSAHPDGYSSNTLAARTEMLGFGTHAVERQYRLSGRGAALPARVRARWRIRPIGMDVLNDLVGSGDLDAAILEHMPTFSFGAQLEWTQEIGMLNTVSAVPQTDCQSYRCLLEPGSKACD